MMMTLYHYNCHEYAHYRFGFWIYYADYASLMDCQLFLYCCSALLLLNACQASHWLAQAATVELSSGPSPQTPNNTKFTRRFREFIPACLPHALLLPTSMPLLTLSTKKNSTLAALAFTAHRRAVDVPNTRQLTGSTRRLGGS